MNNGPGREKPDDGFDRLLRSALSSDETASGSACLDADTLAAWCDGALSPSERSFADAHVARCARCQSMLAVMAQTAPVDVPSRTWSVRQWFMMLAPAATATTAIALWFAVADPSRRVQPQPASRVAMQEADGAHREPARPAAEPPIASAQPAAPTERRDQSAAAPQSADKKSAVTEESRRLADARDASKTRADALDATAKDTFERQRKELGAIGNEEKAKPAAPAAAPTQSVVANSPAIEVNTANNRVSGFSGNANNANNANAPVANAPAATAAGERINALPPPPPAARPATPPEPARPDQQQADQRFRAGVQVTGGAGRGGGGAQAAQSELPLAVQDMVQVAPSFAFAAPDALVQWRVISQRIIQQSVDKGATWATQYTVDEKLVLSAGSSPSSNVAWIVGRLGIVLKSDDGRTWRLVEFPENIDLVGVAAIDRDNAIVTASDRRVFSTTNGGRSWTVKK